jgi:hypothetical protein
MHITNDKYYGLMPSSHKNHMVISAHDHHLPLCNSFPHASTTRLGKTQPFITGMHDLTAYLQKEQPL